MNDIIQTIDLPSKDGFDIKVNALIEDIPIDEVFDHNEEGLKDTIEKLESCELMYFCANVQVSKNGIGLGNDYLGACIYKGLQDFIDDGDYINDMVETAIKEAKQVIKSLHE